MSETGGGGGAYQKQSSSTRCISIGRNIPGGSGESSSFYENHPSDSTARAILQEQTVAGCSYDQIGLEWWES